MNLSLVPAVLFLAIVYFSGSNKQVEPPKEVNETNKLTFRKDSDINFKSVEGVESEYQKNINTIYDFITNKFTKIDKEDAQQISKNLVDYGEKYKLDPKLAAAVIARESSFNKAAVSETGAKGLGQIKDFNFSDLSINDPFSIDQNVSGTVKYLKEMIKNWKEIPENGVTEETENAIVEEEIDVKLGLASYFKGFTAVKNKGIDEKTQQYVDDIIDYYKEIIELEEKTNIKSEE
tara:strand:+ start:5306 stop:6007 length:702 start_codon:yes stop_codon:yes gene_type:complete